MEIQALLKDAIVQQASDVFLVAGRGISYKINGQLKLIGKEKLMPVDTARLIGELYELAHREQRFFLERGDDDFSFSLSEIGRFRINTYKQRSSEAAVIRVVQFALPDAQALGIPEQVMLLAKKKRGLILMTGPAGSGKSTTLACLLNQMNQQREGHIITLEDPIEFIHSHDKSIVSQREIPTDTMSYVQGLRGALREAPDAIFLGEMRDIETMQIAITAAETGQLIFSTLHTLGAAHTIDRMIDVFPAEKQQQIRIQLAMVLQGVISQQLITSVDGNRVPAFEMMLVNPAIRNLIREAKTHQIESMIQASAKEGMMTMDMSLLELYKQKKIAPEQVLAYCTNREAMEKKLQS